MSFSKGIHAMAESAKDVIWSFDEATDEEEEEYMDATTLNKSMIFPDDNNDDDNKPIQSVSTLQQLTKDTLKELEPLKQFKEISLTSSTTDNNHEQQASPLESTSSPLHQMQEPLRPSQVVASPASDKPDISLASGIRDNKEPLSNNLQTSVTLIGAAPQQQLVSNTTMSQDIVETVMDLMKKRDGVLTFGTVESVYSFRTIQCSFKINSIGDEGTIGIYRLCRFESAIVMEDIGKAIIIDSHRRKLPFSCPKDLIDEQEYYQFCFKNESQHVVVASLPFKIMIDEFGSRSVLGQVQLEKLGCLTLEDDDAIMHAGGGNSNSTPEEDDDEGEFVVVRSKKILLEEKIRELKAHISVVEHDRASKRDLINILQSELDQLKEKLSRLELTQRNYESKTKVLTKAYVDSQQTLSVSEKKMTSLEETLEKERSNFKILQQESNAEKAARDAYLNSLRLSVNDLERQVGTLENLVSGLTSKYHLEKIANEKKQQEMKIAVEKEQKKYADLFTLWSDLNLKHDQLAIEKSHLEEIVSQKCKTFAEQEEQSSANIRQLKARLSQAAEEYEELFRKNYRLEKKYNQLQSKMTSMSIKTVDDSDSTTNKSTSQSRSILAEVTGEISKEGDKNHFCDSLDVLENLIGKIKFQQQKPPIPSVQIPRSSYSFDISSIINALLTNPLNLSEKCSQCKNETTNGTLCSACHTIPKEMLVRDVGAPSDTFQLNSNKDKVN